MDNKFLLGFANKGITFDHSNENVYLIDIVSDSEKEYGQKRTNVEDLVIGNPLAKIDTQSDEIIE